MTSQTLESQITCGHDMQILKPIIIQDGKKVYPQILACKECHEFFKTLESFKIISEDVFN